METLLVGSNFINSPLIPAVKFKFSRFGENDGRTKIILDTYHNYTMGSSI